ncbi:MAG: histidinol-phosphatase [Ruminococcus sp.]|nr:histidinol-phosphatase [Ruminococcus sp.]
MLIDFHSHFLPQIDDGSRSIEESVGILDDMAKNGTELVAATPHFYCSEQSIESFVRHRNDAYERLKPHLKPEHPRIILGGEVLFDQALVNHEHLHDLCYEGTDYLLLEMPYVDLTDRIINGVAEMADRGDVKLLIAHIERYLNFTSMKRLDQLMHLDVLGQINAKSMESFKSRSRCLKLISKGYVQVLGSDYHRTDRGDLTVNKGYQMIGKKHPDFEAYAEDCGGKLLDNAQIWDILG